MVFCGFNKQIYGFFIITIKADTRNFSKKYRQIFLLDAIFFEQ